MSLRLAVLQSCWLLGDCDDWSAEIELCMQAACVSQPASVAFLAFDRRMGESRLKAPAPLLLPLTQVRQVLNVLFFCFVFLSCSTLTSMTPPASSDYCICQY